ncbi:copper transport protein ATOX1 [Drosophila hydei]|uniref:Copper transport protein ATOX1 n=1 Tax=Drosophila hydei TaxID=7224 RepID=A0A6J1M459_DROHY|nr:copper transport protein ATOX1 [Drosophila hydei]
MTVHEFKVEMSCGGCASAVEKCLAKLGDKVEKVNINLETKTVSVTSNLPSEELLAQLRKSGKTVSYVGVKK